MSLHLPHRHEPSKVPSGRVEFAVRRTDTGELIEWPCGCPRIYGSYDGAKDSGGEVVKRTVIETPWTLA